LCINADVSKVIEPSGSLKIKLQDNLFSTLANMEELQTTLQQLLIKRIQIVSLAKVQKEKVKKRA